MTNRMTFVLWQANKRNKEEIILEQKRTQIEKFTF